MAAGRDGRRHDRWALPPPVFLPARGIIPVDRSVYPALKSSRVGGEGGGGRNGGGEQNRLTETKGFPRKRVRNLRGNNSRSKTVSGRRPGPLLQFVWP